MRTREPWCWCWRCRARQRRRITASPDGPDPRGRVPGPRTLHLQPLQPASPGADHTGTPAKDDGTPRSGSVTCHA